MQAAIIVGIVFCGVVMALAVVGGTILLAIRIIKGSGGVGREQSAADARMLQEIYQGMARMEERVEALETILIHTRKKDASS
ncbi:MAG: phage-shock protein [Desulfosarcinaceae bacterium]|nr:phage-shock protein [Desulfosarcinaceae bacterium]